MLSQKRLVFSALTLVALFVLRPHPVQSQPQPAPQTTAGGNTSDLAKKKEKLGSEQAPPAKPAESKSQPLEITSIQPETLTASDSKQHVTLTMVGATEGAKLRASFKNPAGGTQSVPDSSVNKGTIDLEAQLNQPGPWEVTISSESESSKPYPFTVRESRSVCRPEPTANQKEAFWHIFWTMNVVAAALFALLVGGLIVAAVSKNGWSLGDALSEESSVQPQPSEIKGRNQVVMVASSSRIIAVFGLSAILALVLGVGYAIVWNLVVCGASPDLTPIKAFLIGMATIFAPYLANQLREVFSPSNPQPKTESLKPAQAAPSTIRITGITPAVRSVDPNPQPISLFGAEFQAWMSVTLTNPNGDRFDFSGNQVIVGGPNQLTVTARLDRGGNWKAVAASAAGKSSEPFDFAVRAPAPTIANIDPANPTAATPALTITGQNFMPNAVATLVDSTGTEIQPPTTRTNDTQMQVQATLSQGNQWRIRIQNPGNDQVAEHLFNVT